MIDHDEHRDCQISPRLVGQANRTDRTDRNVQTTGVMKKRVPAIPAHLVSYCLVTAAPITQTSTTVLWSVDGSSSATLGTTVYGGRELAAASDLLMTGVPTPLMERRTDSLHDGSLDTSANSRPLVALAQIVADWEKSTGLIIEEKAVANSKAAIEMAPFTPDRMAVTEDRSILFSFSSEAKSVLVEFFGTGEIAAVSRDAESDQLFDSDSVEGVTHFIAEALGSV